MPIYVKHQRATSLTIVFSLLNILTYNDMSCVCFCALHLSHLSYSNFNFLEKFDFLKWAAAFASFKVRHIKCENSAYTQ